MLTGPRETIVRIVCVPSIFECSRNGERREGLRRSSVAILLTVGRVSEDGTLRPCWGCNRDGGRFGQQGFCLGHVIRKPRLVSVSFQLFRIGVEFEQMQGIRVVIVGAEEIDLLPWIGFGSRFQVLLPKGLKVTSLAWFGPGVDE